MNFVPRRSSSPPRPGWSTTGGLRAGPRPALEIAGRRLREEQRRVNGDPQGQKLLGIGLSSYIELSGFNPAKDGGDRLGEQHGALRALRQVTVLTGVSPRQGQETTFAQIVSDEFGVPLEDVIVVHGDTATVQ